MRPAETQRRRERNRDNRRARADAELARRERQGRLVDSVNLHVKELVQPRDVEVHEQHRRESAENQEP